MKRILLFLFLFLAVTVPVQAAQEFQQEQFFTPYNQSGYTWGNNGFERYLWLGSYKITDRNQGVYLVSKDTDFSAYACDASTAGQTSYSNCTYYKASYNSSTAKYEISLSESGVSMSTVYFGVMKEVTEPPVDPGDGGTDPGDGENGGGGNVGGTLPEYSLMDDPVFSGTFWNYLGSVLKLGMPFLLIAVALLVLEIVLLLIIGIYKDKRRVVDDDDDW